MEEEAGMRAQHRLKPVKKLSQVVVGEGKRRAAMEGPRWERSVGN